jgi:hypothetical protein
VEKSRPFQKLGPAVLCLAAALLLTGGCGINNTGDGFLELVSSYPSAGETNVKTFGRYALVFSKKLNYSASDAVYASFPPRWYSSGETLFVERLDAAEPPYGRRDSISVSALTVAGGGAEQLRAGFSFTLAQGEKEDNDTREFADTLRPGMSLDGRIGKDDGSVTDQDWFAAVPGPGGAVRVTVANLDTTPLFCVAFLPDTVLSYTVRELGKFSSVVFTGTDTLLLYTTNAYLKGTSFVRYPLEARYRISEAMP